MDKHIGDGDGNGDGDGAYSSDFVRNLQQPVVGSMAGDLAMGVSPALSEFVYRAPTVLSAIAAQPLDKSPTVSTVAPVIPQASTGAVRRLFDAINDEEPVARAVSTNTVPHRPFRADDEEEASLLAAIT